MSSDKHDIDEVSLLEVDCDDAVKLSLLDLSAAFIEAWQAGSQAILDGRTSGVVVRGGKSSDVTGVVPCRVVMLLGDDVQDGLDRMMETLGDCGVEEIPVVEGGACDDGEEELAPSLLLPPGS